MAGWNFRQDRHTQTDSEGVLETFGRAPGPLQIPPGAVYGKRRHGEMRINTSKFKAMVLSWKSVECLFGVGDK